MCRQASRRATKALQVTPLRDARILLGSMIGLAALGSACGGEGRRSRVEADQTPSVVKVTMTDYAFDAPDTLQEGWTTFSLANNGDAIHAAQLVKLGDGTSVDEFREAYARALANDGPWEVMDLLGGIVGPFPKRGSTNGTLHLSVGHYVWYCPLGFEDGGHHAVGRGMMRPFVVVPRDGSAPPTAAPRPSVTITMVDYAFLLSASPAAGPHVFRVENQGPEPHEVVLMKLAPGKTLEDAQAWLGNFRGPSPFSAGLGGVSIHRAGDEAYFEADLTPGNYVLFCVITAPDGRRHLEHGMIMQIAVA